MATPRGTISRDLGRGGRGGVDAAGRRLVEQFAEQERVAAGRLDAGAGRTDRVARSDSRAATSARTAAGVSGDETQQLHGRVGDERRRLGGEHGIERPGREDERERLPLEPASR